MLTPVNVLQKTFGLTHIHHKTEKVKSMECTTTGKISPPPAKLHAQLKHPDMNDT